MAILPVANMLLLAVTILHITTRHMITNKTLLRTILPLLT
jgi:hypothetical protein